MRKILIAGNWKMNQGPEETAHFFEEFSKIRKEPLKKADGAVCPPYVSLNEAKKGADKVEGIRIGAQNLYFEDSGAYTGEVSAAMLKETGCTYVITGHSERRSLFGESDSDIRKKNLKALEHALTPITCVGEVLKERKADRHYDVVREQITGVFEGFDPQQVNSCIIAYEPVWAIGTGETATPQQAQEMHAFIRDLIKEHFGANVAEEIRILYGGSMKPDNAGELVSQPDVDGGLVGGASLKPNGFHELLKIAEKQSG